MKLEFLKGRFSVCKMIGMPPIEILNEPYCFFARTDKEISLVCPEEKKNLACLMREDGWRAFRVSGAMEFSLIGILSRISTVLAEAGVSIFAVSTYDTDYVLIKEENLAKAVHALAEDGYEIYGTETLSECMNVVYSFARQVNARLGGALLSVYLTGSAVYEDFHPGFSDLDFFIVSKWELTERDFDEVHALYEQFRRKNDGWFSVLEGEIVSLPGLSSGKSSTIYWGTSGDRFCDHYTLSGFSMRTLLERGCLLYGQDVRKEIPVPDEKIIRKQSEKMLETVRQYAETTRENAHYADWLFLLSQTLYTLTTGKVTSKTEAAKWMKSHTQEESVVCALETAKRIRFAPDMYKPDMADALQKPIQLLADELEKRLYQ